MVQARRTIRMDNKLWQDILDTAEARGISASEVIRRSVLHYIDGRIHIKDDSLFVSVDFDEEAD